MNGKSSQVHFHFHRNLIDFPHFTQGQRSTEIPKDDKESSSSILSFMLLQQRRYEEGISEVCGSMYMQ